MLWNISPTQSHCAQPQKEVRVVHLRVIFSVKYVSVGSRTSVLRRPFVKSIAISNAANWFQREARPAKVQAQRDILYPLFAPLVHGFLVLTFLFVDVRSADPARIPFTQVKFVVPNFWFGSSQRQDENM
jgi:hypothetical protein